MASQPNNPGSQSKCSGRNTLGDFCPRLNKGDILKKTGEIGRYFTIPTYITCWPFVPFHLPHSPIRQHLLTVRAESHGPRPSPDPVSVSSQSFDLGPMFESHNFDKLFLFLDPVIN